METGSNGSALAVVEPSNSLEANVGVLMRRATDVAGVCRDIVTKTAQSIQGRKYVRVEGWQAIAVAYGCVASARDVEVVNGGVRAIGEVRRMSDGAVISTAEGFVGSDEVTWYGGTDAKGKKHDPRPMYAIRAMAQTRAVSRACRGAFSFVVTLIDSNLSTTPFEEVDGLVANGTTEPPPPVVRGTAGLKNALRPPASPPRATEPPPHRDADFRADEPPHDAQTGEVRSGVFPTRPPTHDRNTAMTYGASKGKPLHELSERDLQWYRKTLTESVADPAKERFLVSNQRALDAVMAELAFRGL